MIREMIWKLDDNPQTHVHRNTSTSDDVSGNGGHRRLKGNRDERNYSLIRPRKVKTGSCASWALSIFGHWSVITSIGHDIVLFMISLQFSKSLGIQYYPLRKKSGLLPPDVSSEHAAMTVGHSNDLNREARIHPSLCKGEKVAERPEVPQASPRRTHPRRKIIF